MIPCDPFRPCIAAVPSSYFTNTPQYLLAGDCGGTNTRLQLIGLTHNHLSHYDIAEHRLPPGDVLKTATYLNEKFKNFHDILSQFLYAEQPVVTPLPSHAVLAAAGPVNGNKGESEGERVGDVKRCARTAHAKRA